jgi:large subunit ribosomal protein L13
MNAKTYSQKPSEVTRKWLLIDASEAPLGRVATQIATYLTGKYKPSYTPHIDGGDYVVVINAEKAVVTGNKELGKVYYRHSGFPGGIKDARLEEVREKHPERIIEAAVRGMLPKNKLSPERMKRLRVFAGSEHTHAAQNPEKVEVK